MDRRHVSNAVRVTAGVLVACAGLSLPSCASKSAAEVAPTVEAQSPAAPVASALDRLIAQATAQKAAAGVFDPSVPPAPGIDAASIAPMPADQVLPTTKGGRSLVETLKELGATWKPPTPPADAPVVTVTPEDKTDALTQYAQARVMLLSNDVAKAIPLLQKATRLDPTSSVIWRELGAANLKLNRRAAGIAALNMAYQFGNTEQFVCWTLGKDMVRSGKTAEGSAMLAHAIAGPAASDDPALANLIAFDLGEALQSDGRVRAARDAFVSALDLPDSWMGETQYRAELADLYRQRFDLWIRVGDLSCRLGEADFATEAYDRASRTPTLDPGMVLSRQVFAALRSGQPAKAALLVLGEFERTEGRLDNRHAELVQYLNAYAGLGTDLGAAVGELASRFQDRATPSVRTRIARVQAAAQPLDAARETLARAALATPYSVEAVSALIESHSSANAASLAAAISRLVESAPIHAPTYAEALLACGRGVEEVLAALGQKPEPAVRLLEASILAQTGRSADAAARLDKVETSIPASELKGAWLALRAEIAADLADSAGVDRCVKGFSSLGEKPLHSANKVAFAVANRAARRTLDAASGVVTQDREDQSVFTWLLGADIFRRAGEGDSAVIYTKKAVDLDQYDEAAYEALIDLHSPNGLVPDATRLNDSARLLRQALPGGRLIRILTARDMLARDMFKDAEGVLTELSRQKPPDARVIELLAVLAERSVKTEPQIATRTEALLASLLAQRPDSPAIMVASARALAAIGKPLPASELLGTRLSYWPMPELAIAREGIIRTGLKDAARADTLTRARLEAAPRTLANATEFAEFLTRVDDLEGAARVLGEALATGAVLSPDQTRSVLTLLGKIPPEPKDDASARGASALFDHVAASSVPLNAPLLVKRVRYAARAYAADIARVYDIAAAAGKAAPELADATYDIVIQDYIAQERFDRVVPITEQIATRTTPWKPVYTQAWLSAIASWGTAADAKRLITSLDTPERLSEFVSLFEDDLGVDTRNTGRGAQPRADIAYWLAGLMLNEHREAEAIAAYRLALEYHPKYHIVANDLGYLLLERNESLDEAASLIEKAHGSLPNNANVIDSIGWLRYKQGRFADTLDENGSIVEEGAVTLLKRAVQFAAMEVPNDTGYEHLGDALWRDGKTTEALQNWRSAADLRERVQAFYQNARKDEERAKATAETLKALRAKIETGEAGGQPTLAPLWPAQ